jgi:group I intron endonuclease
VSRAKAPVIYVISNTVTGKQYVGQTLCGLKERWRKHWRRAEKNKGDCYAIGAAIRKYGKDSFAIKVLRELPVDALQQEIDEAEQAAIRDLGTLSPNGYNLEEGGKGGRPCAEARARQSAALKGKPLSEEHRRKLSEAQSGRIPTPAVIAGNKRRADRLRGVPRSPEAVANMVKAQRARASKPRTEAEKAAAKMHSERMKGRTLSQERRARQSASMKAHCAKHPRSDEHRRKLSESQKGRVFSEETRAKMRAARKRHLECQETISS